MKTRRFIDLINHSYQVEIRTEGFTQGETERMINQGEPEVDVGGNIVGSAVRPGESTPISVDFNLPSELRRLSSDFPLKKWFDLRDDEHSDIKAVVYATTIESRIGAARTALMEQPQFFLGEYVVNFS